MNKYNKEIEKTKPEERVAVRLDLPKELHKLIRIESIEKSVTLPNLIIEKLYQTCNIPTNI